VDTIVGGTDEAAWDREVMLLGSTTIEIEVDACDVACGGEVDAADGCDVGRLDVKAEDVAGSLDDDRDTRVDEAGSLDEAINTVDEIWSLDDGTTAVDMAGSLDGDTTTTDVVVAIALLAVTTGERIDVADVTTAEGLDVTEVKAAVRVDSADVTAEETVDTADVTAAEKVDVADVPAEPVPNDPVCRRCISLSKAFAEAQAER